VPEWLIGPVSKTGVPLRGTEGSNPSSSADNVPHRAHIEEDEAKMRGRVPIRSIPLATAITAALVVGSRFATRSELSTSLGGRSVIRSVPGANPVDALPSKNPPLILPEFRSVSRASPIEVLNYSVQERFRTIDGFGMARLPVVPQHVDLFDPKTPEEKAAVEDLRSRGWTVGLYLGGRGLLEPPMSESEWENAGEHSHRKAISKPIVISGQATPAGLPKPWELQIIGRKALDAAAASDRYEASLGRWSVDARPIRANRAACLKCHTAEGATGFRPRGLNQETDLRLGDALGVAVYVYARKQE
jgi:hypothetical protein